MVWPDILHPMQRLWLMESTWSLPFLPLLPLPRKPIVRVSVGKEEEHRRLPGLYSDPGRMYGKSPGHRLFEGAFPQKETLNEPKCGRSKCICHGQPNSLQVSEAL